MKQEVDSKDEVLNTEKSAQWFSKRSRSVGGRAIWQQTTSEYCEGLKRLWY